MHKKIGILGLGTYFVLLVMSIVFFKERTAFTDIAFHLFYILKDGDFAIQNHRFIAFFTQLFPLLSSKAGLSLETIMKLYSVSFVILNLVVFAILTFGLKIWRYALILLLINTLMVSHTFYWIQSEVLQALPILILNFALIHHYLHSELSPNRKYFILSASQAMLFALAFSHPIIIFPLLFITMFLIIETDKNRVVYVWSFILFLFFYAIKSIFFKTAYDSSASLNGLKNLKNHLPHFLELRSNKLFLEYVVSDYYLLILLLFITCGYYIYKKQLLKFCIVFAFFFGYLAFVNASYPDGADQFYIENLYLPLAVFVSVPLVFNVVNSIKQHHLLYLIGVLLLFRIINIYSNHHVYSKRVDYLQAKIEETNTQSNKKTMIKVTPSIKDTLLMTWATPYEFWLLSTIQNNSSSSILISENIKELEWTLPYNKKFVTQWGAFDYSKLPGKYFILKDTSYYQVEQ